MSDLQGTFPLATTISPTARFLLLDGGVTKEIQPDALAAALGGGGGVVGQGSLPLVTQPMSDTDRVMVWQGSSKEAQIATFVTRAQIQASHNTDVGRDLYKMGGNGFVNVLHYGADPTGLVPCDGIVQTLINRCIDASDSLGGKKLYFPSGKYLKTIPWEIGEFGRGSPRHFKGFGMFGDNAGQVLDYASGNPAVSGPAEGGTFIRERYTSNYGYSVGISPPDCQGNIDWQDMQFSAHYSPVKQSAVFLFRSCENFTRPMWKNVGAYECGVFIVVEDFTASGQANGEFGYIENSGAENCDGLLDIQHGESYFWYLVNSGANCRHNSAGSTMFKISSGGAGGGGLVINNITGTFEHNSFPVTQGARSCLFFNRGGSPIRLSGGRIEHVSSVIECPRENFATKLTINDCDITTDNVSDEVGNPFPYVFNLQADSSSPGLGRHKVNCKHVNFSTVMNSGQWVKDLKMFNQDCDLEFEDCSFGFHKGNTPQVEHISGPSGGYTSFKRCTVAYGANFAESFVAPYERFYGSKSWGAPARRFESNIFTPSGRANNLLKNPEITAYVEDATGVALVPLAPWVSSLGGTFSPGSVHTRGSNSLLRLYSSSPAARVKTFAGGEILSQDTGFNLAGAATETDSYNPYGTLMHTLCYNGAMRVTGSGRLQFTLENTSTGYVYDRMIVGANNIGYQEVHLGAIVYPAAGNLKLVIKNLEPSANVTMFMDFQYLGNNPDATYGNGGASAYAGTEHWSANAKSIRAWSRLALPYKSHVFGKDAVQPLGDLESDLYIGKEDNLLTAYQGNGWAQYMRSVVKLAAPVATAGYAENTLWWNAAAPAGAPLLWRLKDGAWTQLLPGSGDGGGTGGALPALALTDLDGTSLTDLDGTALQDIG